MVPLGSSITGQYKNIVQEREDRMKVQGSTLKSLKRDQVPIKKPRKPVCLGAEVITITNKDVLEFREKTDVKTKPSTK